MDFAYQKYNFGKEMMMEKFEVKQEYKNTEGDPHIKSKRRQIAQEMAYQEGPGGGVRSAQAVVTNPTELAIALGYKRGIDAAPYILGMGEGVTAKMMVTIAKKHDIPIVRNIKLAHTLWDHGELYEYVPESTYEPIAQIIRWVQALDTENAYEYEEQLT
jgi:flagellar biosynthesis protein FlhB